MVTPSTHPCSSPWRPLHDAIIAEFKDTYCSPLTFWWPIEQISFHCTLFSPQQLIAIQPNTALEGRCHPRETTCRCGRSVKTRGCDRHRCCGGSKGPPWGTVTAATSQAAVGSPYMLSENPKARCIAPRVRAARQPPCLLSQAAALPLPA